ncbi:MAG: NifB/NifX family molybdenum-iron cluster-binding protein [Desulfosporosinus sp.]|nr:NifB/NifX family molybdenum-iron cluster-binding protein [Desulfosporosinus sp.]
MNIAVAADGKSLESQVSERFELCSYMLIVNMDDLTVNAINKDELLGTSLEENLAQKVLEYNCEAVITGNINLTAFNILTDAYVTRYYGAGHSVKDALELSEKQLLKLIKEECKSNHHH